MVVSIVKKRLAFLLVIIYYKKCSFYFIGRQMSGLFCSLLYKYTQYGFIRNAVFFHTLQAFQICCLLFNRKNGPLLLISDSTVYLHIDFKHQREVFNFFWTKMVPWLKLPWTQAICIDIHFVNSQNATRGHSEARMY